MRIKCLSGCSQMVPARQVFETPHSEQAHEEEEFTLPGGHGLNQKTNGFLSGGPRPYRAPVLLGHASRIE